MQVRVLYFGVLKELLKRDGERIELPAKASVDTLLQALRGARTENGAVWKSLAVAVNREYADVDCALHEGDEVALLPPVSGGVELEMLSILAQKVRASGAAQTHLGSFDSASRDKAARCSAQDDGSLGQRHFLLGLVIEQCIPGGRDED